MRHTAPPATSNLPRQTPQTGNLTPPLHRTRRTGVTLDTVLLVFVNLAISGVITLIAVIWAVMNIRRQYQGPLLVKLSHSHGVHLFDVAVLVVELLLVGALTVSLVYTATRSPAIAPQR